MKISAISAFATLSCIALVSCGQMPVEQKNVQSDNGQALANAVHYDENFEQENIQSREKLEGTPGEVEYILVTNNVGQPILYSSVKGKITSSHKRLTKNYAYDELGSGYVSHAAANDDGTYGDSTDYIYWKDMDGAYHQTSMPYILSDRPFRLTIQPLVISTDLQKKTSE